MVGEKQNFTSRPPVVVVMGHVDSGKTSILDYIREANVAEKESGGITQHIGAYQIDKNGKKITFIDTPGHEAFSQMRSRGSKIADIAVLVVDATKGVQQQTKEAILHIKKAGIPFVVALNKIDRPESNRERVKGELAKDDVIVESLGGKVPLVETSAKSGKGMNELLDMILILSEMEDLKADLSALGQGAIIESYMDPKRGPTATLVLDDGVMKIADIAATHSTLGKIKNLEDFKGKKIEEAFPSQPVIVIGFENVPKVGENFKVFPDSESAQKYLKPEEKAKTTVLDLRPDQKVVNIVLKADVVGSIEAIEEVLSELPKDKIILRILKSDVGEINENDVKLARSGKALIVSFRVKANSIAMNMARKERIRILNFDVIYDLVEEVRKFMERSLEMEVFEEEVGQLKVLASFWSDKNRQIVGGRIIRGGARKGTLINVFRQNEKIGSGKTIGLQRNKKDIEKASKGEEIGILYEGEGRIEVGDILVIYTKERRKGELS